MKTVCAKHEQAYEVGENCPWCEPESWEVKTPWIKLDSAPAAVGVDYGTGSYAVWVDQTIALYDEALARLTDAEMRKLYGGE